MRGIGCLFVSLLVLVGVLAGADLAVTNYAERRQADDLQKTLDAETVTVDLRGWPVAARMLTGTIPEAGMTATSVPLDNGATLDRLDVVLSDVEVRVTNLGNESQDLPPAREGTFEAEISEQSIVDMLGLPGDVVNVTLDEGALVLEAVGARLAADVVAENGDVVIKLRGPLARLAGGGQFPIDLSQEPGAPAVEEVVIRDGSMVVRGVLEDVRR